MSDNLINQEYCNNFNTSRSSFFKKENILKF